VTEPQSPIAVRPPKIEWQISAEPTLREYAWAIPLWSTRDDGGAGSCAWLPRLS
jgi:hypothetical protein